MMRVYKNCGVVRVIVVDGSFVVVISVASSSLTVVGFSKVVTSATGGAFKILTKLSCFRALSNNVLVSFRLGFVLTLEAEATGGYGLLGRDGVGAIVVVMVD